MEKIQTPLHKAIEAVGGQAELARALGVSQQAVSYWLIQRGARCPGEYVFKVAQLSGMSLHELRPDLFEDAGSSEAQAIEGAA